MSFERTRGSPARWKCPLSLPEVASPASTTVLPGREVGLFPSDARFPALPACACSHLLSPSFSWSPSASFPVLRLASPPPTLRAELYGALEERFGRGRAGSGAALCASQLPVLYGKTVGEAL